MCCQEVIFSLMGVMGRKTEQKKRRQGEGGKGGPAQGEKKGETEGKRRRRGSTMQGAPVTVAVLHTKRNGESKGTHPPNQVGLPQFAQIFFLEFGLSARTEIPNCNVQIVGQPREREPRQNVEKMSGTSRKCQEQQLVLLVLASRHICLS